LDQEAARYFRDQLREGRAAALRDAEGFQEILFALERLGGLPPQSIGRWRLPERDSRGGWCLSFGRGCSCRLPVLARTILAVVQVGERCSQRCFAPGALARHLTNSAVQVAFVLEDALMSNQNMAGDYMVREPVCASLWQPLSFIRQKILANSFTYLPVWCSTDWRLLSEYQLARYLREGDRKKRLASTLKKGVGCRPEARRREYLPSRNPNRQGAGAVTGQARSRS